MRGSDLDIVFVIHELIEVCEELKPGFNSKITHFVMERDDVKPSYTLLRLVNRTCKSSEEVSKDCDEYHGELYLSGALHKQRYLFGKNRVHGPCISDEDGLFDGAISLHCKTWVSPAIQWITRSSNSWPSHNVKQSITKHGVLFVPIGVKGSPKEDIEWRISFSVGEKLLINTFTHTQLLCYALLKIILKDVISTYSECDDLLCSYFLKTIMFWISEELPQSIWKPVNTIPCFMRCFSRLVYCVEYSVCSHYFIPEHNMFETKIEGRNRKILLEKLNTLYSYGWQCILFSDQFDSFCEFEMWNLYIIQYTDSLFVHDVVKLLSSNMLFFSHLYFQNSSINMEMIFRNGLFQTMMCQQSSIKGIYLYYMSMCFSAIAKHISLNSAISNNKYKYKQYNYCLSTLLQNVYHDAVSGWLMIASFFYKTKQYIKALEIIRYSLSKCTLEKLCHCMTFSEEQLLILNLFEKKSYACLERIMLVEDITFINSSISPDELSNDLCWCPSIAYAHFLELLCHYQRKNFRECRSSLESLELVITNNYLMSQSKFKDVSETFCGIALDLLGHN